jgi:sentrin-specific protease 7
MGGFKPVNTLHEKPHASKGVRPTVSADVDHVRSMAAIDAFKKTTTPRKSPVTPRKLALETNEGGHVQHVRADLAQADGALDFGPAAKRQKTHHVRRLDEAAISPVDLTAEDTDAAVRNGEVRSINERSIAPSMSPPPEKRVRGRRAKPQPPLFTGNNQLKMVNEKVKPNSTMPGASQGSQSGRPSSQSSSRPASAHGVWPQPGHSHPGSRNSPVDLVDEEGSTQQPAAVRQRRTIPQHDERLPLDRGRGVDPTQKQKVESGFSTDDAKAVRIFDIFANPAAAVRPPSPRQQSSTNRALSPPAVTAFQALLASGTATEGSPKAQHRKDKVEPRLSKVFRRDGATSGMQETSSAVFKQVPCLDDSQSSIDELSGEPTVATNECRSASPVKRLNRVARSHSPSNIRPTTFTHSKRDTVGQPSHNQAKYARKEDQRDSSDHDYNATDVQAFYASSCYLPSGKLRLMYDNESNSLELWSGEAPCTILGKNKVVSLGSGEARILLYSALSSNIVLKGSATDVSTGHICIAFPNRDGVNWFFNTISSVTGDKCTFQAFEDNRLNRIFSQQVKDLQKANQLTKVKAGSDLNLKRQYEATKSREVSGERIISGQEQEESLPRKKESRRQAMLGPRPGGMPAAAGKNGSSPYFPPSGPTRRSTRERKPIQERVPSPPVVRWTQKHELIPWKRPVEYPAQGQRRVTVDFVDLERLDEGEFLNDSVISFGLRKLEEEMSEEHKEQVHFFNTFFYTSLATKNGRKGFYYDAVKKWTKNTDIFSKPFVVVPINIDIHWIVAIICNLDKLSRKFAGDLDRSPVNVEKAQAPEADDEEQPESSLQYIDTKEAGDDLKDEAIAMRDLSLSQPEASSLVAAASPSNNIRELDNDANLAASTHDERAEQSRPQASRSNKKGRKKAPTAIRKFDVEQPSIIVLDSLGTNRPAEIRNLKDYLCYEADAKRGMEVDVNDLQGLHAKGLPQQTNFCDCGVYVLGYIERFARDPRAFTKKALMRELDPARDFATFDPSKKRDEIRTQLLALHEKQEAEHREKKKLAMMSASTAQTRPTAKSTDAADKSSATTSRAPALESRERSPAQSKRQAAEAKKGADVRQPPQLDGEEEELETVVPIALDQPIRKRVIHQTHEFNGSDTSDTDEVSNKPPTQAEAIWDTVGGNGGRKMAVLDKLRGEYWTRRRSLSDAGEPKAALAKPNAKSMVARHSVAPDGVKLDNSTADVDGRASVVPDSQEGMGMSANGLQSQHLQRSDVDE